MRQLALWAATALAAAAALVAPGPDSVARAQDTPRFAGAAEIRAGQTVQTSIAGLPGEVHQYRFYAVAGSRLSARVAADAGGSLLPELRLTRPGGEVLATGTAASPSRVTTQRLDRYVLPFSGHFVLEVAPRAGAGGYRLATRLEEQRRISGLDPAPGSEGTWRFDAPGGSLVTIRVRAPGRFARGAGPRIAGLLGPDGAPIDIVARTRGQNAVANTVLLAQSGTYTVLWENPGGARRLRFKFVVRPFVRPTDTLTFPTPTAIAPGAPEVGTSVLGARTGYVGSAACGRCHDDIYADWTGTTHHLGAREWQRAGLTGLSMVNDANGNGRDDFRDARNLAGDALFAGIADAPRLAYVAGDPLPYKVTIGGVRYDVAATAGGNGIHQQSYLARIGDALYPLPFEYDELRRAYAPFETAHWYGPGGAALHATAAAVPPAASYEVRCAGCHATGLVLEARPTGEIVGGHAEPGVGCEQCHGPGAAHAASGDPALIQNPADLLDGTAAGVAAANAVCARCHDRGDALETVTGSTARPAFGYTRAGGVAELGDDPSQFRSASSDPDDFWGYKANPVPAVLGASAAAARTRYLQGTGIARGSHGPEFGFSPTCFECHTPHRRSQAAMLATEVNRGTRVRTRLDDNTLCLSCHATHGPFANVPKGDVADVSRGLVPASIVSAVTDHMRDIGMAVPTFLYDPTGSGVGRCDTCHMPRTAGGGVFGTDAAGHALGDRASHEFRVVWPRVSELYGVTNSCSGCHPTAADDPVQTIIEQWARPDADGDGTFHSDTPRSFQNGVKNPGTRGGLPCVQCHTTEGFVRIQVRGEATTQDDWNAMLVDAIGHDEGITCAACHGSGPDGTFSEGDRNSLRFPAKDLCGRCHNDETIKFGDFRDEGEIVRHPQREMLLGTAGSESPGTGGYSDTAHSLDVLFPRGCADCHYDHGANGDPSHDFKPRVETCQRCHGRQLTTFDRPANGDYDGDGAVEGIQTEVDGLLAVLRDALTLHPDVTFDGRSFNYMGATDGRMTGATTAQKRAAFNYYTVVGDASRGVHNAIRTVQLLQRSYLELTGTTVPGATLR